MLRQVSVVARTILAHAFLPTIVPNSIFSRLCAYRNYDLLDGVCLHAVFDVNLTVCAQPGPFIFQTSHTIAAFGAMRLGSRLTSRLPHGSRAWHVVGDNLKTNLTEVLPKTFPYVFGGSLDQAFDP